jgi:hypothetical protein
MRAPASGVQLDILVGSEDRNLGSSVVLCMAAEVWCSWRNEERWLQLTGLDGCPPS